MPRAGTKPKASFNTFSGSRYSTPACTPWFVVPTLQSCPIFWGGQHSPVLQLQEFSTALIFLPVTPAKQQRQKPVPPYLTWSYGTPALQWLGGISCPKTTVTTAHPAASWLLPGPELLCPRKDIFPKAVWGEGERHYYNPTPAPPSKTMKERKKKKATTPWAASMPTHLWEGWTQPREEGQEHRPRVPQPCQAWAPCARQGTPGAPVPHATAVVASRGHQEPSPGEMPGRGLSHGNSHHHSQPPDPTQFTFGFWTLPAEPKVSLESWPNWHSSYSPLHSSYVISSVAQRRKGSSGFLSVGTMLHLNALHATTPKLCLRHTSVSASPGRLQLEFKALHSERATPASQL